VKTIPANTKEFTYQGYRYVKVASSVLVAEIDPATREKWKRHKGAQFFKELAEDYLKTLIEQKSAGAKTEDLKGFDKAVESAAGGVEQLFDDAYNKALDGLDVLLARVTGMETAKLLKKLLIADQLDRLAFAVAYEAVASNLDEAYWKRVERSIEKQQANSSQQMAQNLLKRAIPKKYKKKLDEKKLWKLLYQTAFNGASKLVKEKAEVLLGKFENTTNALLASQKEKAEEQKAAKIAT